MITRTQVLALLAGGAPALKLARAVELPDITPGPFKGTRKPLMDWQVPAWYRDAKFGIWAHWGPQSAAEYGDWYADLASRIDGILGLDCIGNVRNALEACNLKCSLLKEEADNIDGVTLGTMHRAKGLEFKAVGVIGCDADTVPVKTVVDSIEDTGDREAFIEQERNLLCVACSRARERLLISYTGKPSRFLNKAEGTCA